MNMFSELSNLLSMCLLQYGNGRRRHKRTPYLSIQSAVLMETLERYKHITDKEPQE